MVGEKEHEEEGYSQSYWLMNIKAQYVMKNKSLVCVKQKKSKI